MDHLTPQMLEERLIDFAVIIGSVTLLKPRRRSLNAMNLWRYS